MNRWLLAASTDGVCPTRTRRRTRPATLVACACALVLSVTSCGGSSRATSSTAAAATTVDTAATTASSTTTTPPTTAATTTTATTTPTTTSAATTTTTAPGPVEETISTADTIVSEADGFADTIVTLNAPAAAVITVTYNPLNQTAVAGNLYDYVPLYGFLTFAPGETRKVIHTQLIDDNVAEPLETYQITLSKPVGASISTPYAQVTIIDNDTIVEFPGLYAYGATVDEKAGTATVAVLLGGPAGQASLSPVAVNYSTNAGTATDRDDYTTTVGILSFAPGDTVQTIEVPIIDDATGEPAETFTVTLAGATAATIATGTATVNIGASDALAAASPLLSGADTSVTENSGFADTVVTLGAPATAPVTVKYTPLNQTAVNGGLYDYVAVFGYLTFAPGETTRVIHTQLIDDIVAEPLETFQITFSAAVGATIATPFATVTVNDND